MEPNQKNFYKFQFLIHRGGCGDFGVEPAKGGGVKRNIEYRLLNIVCFWGVAEGEIRGFLSAV